MGRVLDLLIEELGREAVKLARRRIPSSTLRKALEFQRLSENHARLFIPHFWAIYQHDGRGGFGTRRARVLVFYRDPNDDPRLIDGYPVRVRDIRKLTRDQFQEGLRRNRELEKSNPGGGAMQFMVIRQQVGPTRPAKSYPFFEEGMSEFPAMARQIIHRAITLELRSIAINESDSVTLRI